MTLCLSRDELIDLSGYKRRSKVASWLTERGYKFEIAADGWPRVLRAAIEQQLMPKGAARKAHSRTEPNWAVLDELGVKARSRELSVDKR